MIHYRKLNDYTIQVLRAIHILCRKQLLSCFQLLAKLEDFIAYFSVVEPHSIVYTLVRFSYHKPKWTKVDEIFAPFLNKDA